MLIHSSCVTHDCRNSTDSFKERCHRMASASCALCIFGLCSPLREQMALGAPPAGPAARFPVCGNRTLHRLRLVLAGDVLMHESLQREALCAQATAVQRTTSFSATACRRCCAPPMSRICRVRQLRRRQCARCRCRQPGGPRHGRGVRASLHQLEHGVQLSSCTGARPESTRACRLHRQKSRGGPRRGRHYEHARRVASRWSVDDGHARQQPDEQPRA